MLVHDHSYLVLDTLLPLVLLGSLGFVHFLYLLKICYYLKCAVLLRFTCFWDVPFLARNRTSSSSCTFVQAICNSGRCRAFFGTVLGQIFLHTVPKPLFQIFGTYVLAFSCRYVPTSCLGTPPSWNFQFFARLACSWETLLVR